MTPDLINAVAKLVRDMPRNLSVIAVDEALKAAIKMKPAAPAAKAMAKKKPAP